MCETACQELPKLIVQFAYSATNVQLVALLLLLLQRCFQIKTIVILLILYVFLF